MNTYTAHPPVRNMIGWLLNAMAGPDLARYWARVEAVKIKNDLLTAAIGQKLGKEHDIIDLFTGHSLSFRTDQGCIVHPGEDGQYDTRDDIRLEAEAGLLPDVSKARTDNLEKYLGLYKVINVRHGGSIKEENNPSSEIKFFEIVKGIFEGINPDQAAFVVWKIHKDETEASYEAFLIKQHQTLKRTKNKLWLAGDEEADFKEYLILSKGEITGYRFVSTTRNKAGIVFKRDFNYQLAPVSRKEIKKYHLSYPSAVPSFDADTQKYKNSIDTIHQKAVLDETLFSPFFNSEPESLKWHIIKDENGHFEDTLDGHVSSQDKAGYPVLVQNLSWKILSKKLVLTTLDFKNGVPVFGWICVEFEETEVFNNEMSTKGYKIEGFFKPIIFIRNWRQDTRNKRAKRLRRPFYSRLAGGPKFHGSLWACGPCAL